MLPLRGDSTKSLRIDNERVTSVIEEVQIGIMEAAAPYPAPSEFNSTTVRNGRRQEYHHRVTEPQRTKKNKRPFSLRLCDSVVKTVTSYTISIFAFARRLFARFDRSFSYLLFCNSVRTSFLTLARLCFCGGLCAFSRKIVKAFSIWITPLTCPACTAYTGASTN